MALTAAVDGARVMVEVTSAELEDVLEDGELVMTGYRSMYEAEEVVVGLDVADAEDESVVDVISADDVADEDSLEDSAVEEAASEDEDEVTSATTTSSLEEVLSAAAEDDDGVALGVALVLVLGGGRSTMSATQLAASPE